MKKITHAKLKLNKVIGGELSMCVDVRFDDKPQDSEPTNYMVMYNDQMTFIQHLHFTQKDTNDDYSRPSKGFEDYFKTGPMAFWGNLMHSKEGISIDPKVLFIKSGIKNGQPTDFISLKLNDDIQQKIDKASAIEAIQKKKDDENSSNFMVIV
jgi:hypothetical protein